MAAYPVKAKKRALPKPAKDQVVVEPAAAPFFSFRYSSTEVSLVDGKTRVRSRSARFEDGKLSSETCEGELDRGAYERMVGEAQRYLWKSLSLFVPRRD